MGLEYLPTFRYHKFRINVGKYYIHGAYGIGNIHRNGQTLGPAKLLVQSGECEGFGGPTVTGFW